MSTRRPRINTGDSKATLPKIAVIGRAKSAQQFLNGRSRAGRRAKAVEAELLADLAKQGPVNATRRLLAGAIGRTAVLLGMVDDFLMKAPRELSRRQRWKIPASHAFRTALENRERLAARLSRDLAALGLERAEQPGTTLSEYLRQRYGGGEDKREQEADTQRNAPPDGSAAPDDADGDPT